MLKPLKSIEETINELRLKAVSQIGEDQPLMSQYRAMLAYGNTLSQTIGAAMCYIVAMMATEIGKDTSKDRDLLADKLRLELQALDFSSSKASETSAIGAIVLPFCSDNNIQVDDLMVSPYWGRMQEVVPVLRKACFREDVEEVQSILEFIRNAANRKQVRKKYAGSRTCIGYGSIIEAPNGPIVLIKAFPSATEEIIKEKLYGLVDFEIEMDKRMLTRAALAGIARTDKEE